MTRRKILIREKDPFSEVVFLINKIIKKRIQISKKEIIKFKFCEISNCLKVLVGRTILVFENLKHKLTLAYKCDIIKI